MERCYDHSEGNGTRGTRSLWALESSLVTAYSSSAFYRNMRRRCLVHSLGVEAVFMAGFLQGLQCLFLVEKQLGRRNRNGLFRHHAPPPLRRGQKTKSNLSSY
ncbi:unnamed protein product [Sphacelaria rigidula]